MARLKLITIGNKMPSWIEAGVKDYSKRFPTDWPLQLKELSAEMRTENSNLLKIKTKETEKLFTACDALVIRLDERGVLLDTLTLAKKCEEWATQSSSLNFIIGGADGLDLSVGNSHFTWSLSPLTFPHSFARLLVIEQLYRAVMVIKKHPYHRS